ncbi:hypothetical protein [Labilibaculum euxinus]
MITCIYPFDSTTSFLDGVENFLVESLKDKIKIIRPAINEEAHLKVVYDLAKLPNKSVVIFMGHGCNLGFHGSTDGTEDNNFDFFINSTNINTLKHLTIIAFACKSESFLKKIGESRGLVSYLGFGDLPTSKEELKEHITNDIEDNILEKLLKEYINCILTAFKYGMSNYINLSRLYFDLKLILNKRSSDIIINNKDTIEYRQLANLIFKTKNKIRYKVS